MSLHLCWAALLSLSSRMVHFKHSKYVVCSSAFPKSVLRTGQPGACPDLRAAFLLQIKEKAHLPAFKAKEAEAALTEPSASPDRQLEHSWNSGGSFPSDAPAAAESSPPVRKQVPHLALLAPDVPAAAKSPPHALLARPAPKQAMRSDTQV